MDLRRRRFLRLRSAVSTTPDSSADSRNASAINDALQTAKSPQDLERDIDSLERWSQLCALLVVVGVILENIRESTTHFFKIGGSLIALGVAGELLFGLFGSRKEHQLRDQRAIEITKLNRTIAELNQVAEHERLERVKIQQAIAGIRFEM
jgi:hypothetical protein